MYLIDTEILKFYELSSENGESDYFFKDDSYTFNWENIEKLFPPKELNFDYPSFQILQPVYKASHEIYEKFKNSEILKKDLKWFFKDFKQSELEEDGILCSLLELTSSFEHEMGNVFHTHTKGTSVPHLLKDLLQYKGFLEIFGDFEIYFVRFLLGNPQSINLRNIIWHGFPYPSQIPTEFLSTLILVVVNFSQTLQRQNFELKRRPKIKILREIEFTSTESKYHLVDSKYYPETHKPIFKDILEKIEEEKYFKVAILILPQIELVLRLIYKDLNNYDVSAKLDEYYITLDTIFEKTVPGRSDDNKIFSSEEIISKSSLTFLYDLFIAPSGLRLRDKIGHGEVSLEAVDKRTCEHLFFIFLQISCEGKFSYRSQYARPCQVDSLIDQQIQNHEKLFTLNICESSKVQSSKIHRSSRSHELEIFHRSTSEVETTNRVYSILENLNNIGNNLYESYSEKMKLLESRELRSRNRKTLTRMIELFAEFVHFYGRLILFSGRVFSERTTFQQINIAKLKKVKTIVENFEKYSYKNCNEWVNIIDLINEFDKLL
ncbi:ERMARD family protein [Megaselia abdita]